MSLLSIFKKNRHDAGMAGLSLLPAGVAVAAVHRVASQTPQLSDCKFEACQPEARASVLGRLLHSALYYSRTLNSCLPQSDFDLQMIEAPDVPADELAAAVRWKVKDLLPFPVEQATIDVFEIPGQKERGRTPAAYVVSARKEAVRAHIDLIEDVTSNLDSIDIPALAQRNIAALLPEDQKGVVMVSLAENSGLVTVTRGQTLYLARNLDIGYRSLVAQASPLEDDGSGLSLDEAPAQQRAFDNVILEIQRSLDYYESHFAMPPVSALVLAPLPESVPGMMTYIAENLGLPTRIMDLNDVLDSRTPLSEQIQSQCWFAIGAALREQVAN